MPTLTQSQIITNRQTWIALLLDPATKKAKEVLDRGGGARCCLGHGCFALGLAGEKILSGSYSDVIEYAGELSVAPRAFMRLVGLWFPTGERQQSSWPNKPLRGLENLVRDDRPDEGIVSLASLNDKTNYTPQQIGDYLMSVIAGGPDTPFRPLSEFADA